MPWFEKATAGSLTKGTPEACRSLGCKPPVARLPTVDRDQLGATVVTSLDTAFEGETMEASDALVAQRILEPER